MRKGTFITLEGPEGSGKSTHIRLLGDFLRFKRRKVLLTREPGGSKLAAGIRELLLNGDDGLCSMAELFLYEADRAQHVEEVIRPALRKGWIVLCDRYTDSTLAYQGYGRGLPMKAVSDLNAIASGGLLPDLTILLDVPVERGLKLAHQKKKGHDRLERAGLAFHKRVRAGFLSLARKNPRRFRVIAQQPALEDTQTLIRQAAAQALRLA